MFKAAQLTILLLIATVIPAHCSADLVLKYTGETFTDFQGDAFSTSDRITALVTFESVGKTQAKAFFITTTLKGNSAFTFDVPDASKPEVLANSFTNWEGSLPTMWTFEVFREVYGSAEEGAEEQVLISNPAAIAQYFDVAYVDGQSVGANTAPGTWSVVPEPSSFCLAGIAFCVGLLGMWRGRRKPAA